MAKGLIAAVSLLAIVWGCSSIRVDTAENCLIEAEQFWTVQFWTNINCTDNESGTLESAQEVIVDELSESSSDTETDEAEPK